MNKKMDNTIILTTFTKILTFVKQMKEEYSTKYDNLRLYYKLLKITPVSKDKQIKKHVDIFRQYLTENKEFIKAKKVKIELLKSDNIVFSDKAYINLKQILSESTVEIKSAILKHLQLIYIHCYPEEKQDILSSPLSFSIQSSTPQSGLPQSALPPSSPEDMIKNLFKQSSDEDCTNEIEFISQFAEETRKTFEQNDFKNDIGSVFSLFTSPMFKNMVSTMNDKIKGGDINIGKLMGSMKGVVKNLASNVKENLGEDESNELDSLIDDPSKLINQMLQPVNGSPLGGLGGMMSSMGMNVDSQDMNNISSMLMMAMSPTDNNASDLLKMLPKK